MAGDVELVRPEDIRGRMGESAGAGGRQAERVESGPRKMLGGNGMV